MSDSFNPYSEWLGLATSVDSPNHYQLLGLDASVTDPAAIASAADRAMTRVRACKPGSQAAAWAHLLDRITEAKKTLTDPAQRQQYDQQRMPQVVPRTAAVQAAPVNPDLLPPMPHGAQPTGAQPASIDPMAPVAIGPLPLAPQVQPTPIPQAVPYLQPATSAPDPMAPVANPIPGAGPAPTIPQMPPNPMAPVAPTAPRVQAIPVTPSPAAPIQPVTSANPSAPYSAPLGVSPNRATSTAGQPATVGIAPKVNRKPTVSSRVRAKSGGMMGLIILFGGAGGLILLVAGVGFYLAGANSDQASLASGTLVPGSDNHGGNGSTLPRRLDEIPESERPRVEPFELPQPTPEPEPPPIASLDPIPQPDPEPSPPPTEPPTNSLADTSPTANLSRDETRSLAKALTTARAAIGELNFPLADREIAKALTLAKQDDHKAKIGRLQLLSDHVLRFRTAISESLSQLSGGEAIRFENDLVINVIESSAERLILRVSGQRREYTINEMPPGLANRLAEMSLDPSAPETIAMKAAYLSVNPRISDKDLAKAQVWWEEAASAADLQDLITAINDDYSLQKDILAIPLDPAEVSALGARAERLKDARTIEAFAKEYQSAIDESLQTLEPDMELSVGGSTTVTIKELKPDRLMLIVADQTRGFQRAKLPLGLASSIAERILPRDAPLTMVMKGAYFAAREKDQSNKQFRPMVIDWWKQAGQMDEQLQSVIRELATQYPE